MTSPGTPEALETGSGRKPEIIGQAVSVIAEAASVPVAPARLVRDHVEPRICITGIGTLFHSEPLSSRIPAHRRISERS